mmetsp:Transcript_30410/g.51705  ORF Transcript_30410/g.51705 Transcript_30410/m.51705 type:complete len:297 (-) Transcript_30410:174-1064(-)
MSVVEETDDIMMCCASCGIAGVDDVKLKKCIACYLVKYCSIKCQREHRSQHKKECKKRAAELRDEILFKQPESSHHGDCPICFLPLSLDNDKSSVMSCCSKIICDGCNEMRELEGKIQPKCPFCRHSPPKSQAEARKNNMKRVEANDPVAMCQMGRRRYSEGDYDGAFEYFSKAAALGDIVAHNNLSVMYQKGEGVEKDDKKAVHHLEQAAIGGVPFARHNLGIIENRDGRMDRATKHFIIAAKLGYDNSMKTVKEGFKRGLVSKEDFAAALRGHQAAIDATKSPQRDEAELARKL